MNLITDIPLVYRHNSILVVVDQGHLKGGNFDPMQQNTYFRRHGMTYLYKQFGLPDKIISDRGPQFTSRAFVKLLKLLGIKLALSTAYRPQTNGTTK